MRDLEPATSAEVREGGLEAVPVLAEPFETFYGRDHKSVVGLAYVLCGSASAAEDLAQEAFLQAFRNWDRLVAYDDPGAWVRRVVANRAVSRYRRLAAEARALFRASLHRPDLLEIDADALAVWAEVRRLPSRQAQVIALRFYEGRTVTDIARVLDTSENTVKTHLARAKKTLATQLGEEESDGTQ